MRETTRAGRSPAEAWEREKEAPALGSALLGARLVSAARVAAMVHLARATGGAGDEARPDRGGEVES